MIEFLSALGLTVGFPLVLSGAVACTTPGSRLDWLLSALLCVGVATYLYLTSAVWIWIAVEGRLLPTAAAVCAALWSARGLGLRPTLPPMRLRRLARTAVGGAMIAVIAAMLVNIRMGSLAPEGAVDLAFPLAHGRFAVVQGGGAAALNRHRAVPAQSYAIDIVALNDRGRRARGLRPGSLDGYEAYGREVFAPCEGTVLGTSDGAPDAPIGRVDSATPAGNHVLLFCAIGDGGLTLVLAHFRPGSVAVARGEQVRTGTVLGRVGNSGNSTEPHLHIHAVRGRETDLGAALTMSEAVPVTFNGHFLVRNAVIRMADRQ